MRILFCFEINLAKKIDTLWNPGCCLIVQYKEITEIQYINNVSYYVYKVKCEIF